MAPHTNHDSPAFGLQTRVDVALQAQAQDQLTLPAVLTFSKSDCGLMTEGETQHPTA